MKANELRIGNWFSSHTRVKVTGDIIAALAEVERLGQKVIIGGIKPIPLTPEILTSALGAGWNIKAGQIQYVKTELVFGFEDNEYGMDLDNVTPVKYVHQLQNLYFALTGEELDIEL